MKKLIGYIAENFFQILAGVLLSVMLAFFSPLARTIQTVIIFISFLSFLKFSGLFITSILDYFNKTKDGSAELISFGFCGAVLSLAIIVLLMVLGDLSSSGNCDYVSSRSGLTCL
jgi:uncharacterized membrane protein YdcZ (DUF606 family)